MTKESTKIGRVTRIGPGNGFKLDGDNEWFLYGEYQGVTPSAGDFVEIKYVLPAA